jgi:UPF0176 protein
VILNIAAYQFVHIDDPQALATHLHQHAKDCELRGTVLIASEGINLFLAGDPADVSRFVDELHADTRLAAIRIKKSHSDVQPFAQLKVKVKSEIISFRCDGASPLENGPAPAVAPQVLARWIEQGHDDAGRRLVLLDTRNREEVGHGTFAGALTLPIDNFTDLPEAIAPYLEGLSDATVVGFCTGGIRCEKAVLWLRNAGMDNVLQLDGGILGYFEEVGSIGYEGHCFVFDERMAVDAQLKPLMDETTAI